MLAVGIESFKWALGDWASWGSKRFCTEEDEKNETEDYKKFRAVVRAIPCDPDVIIRLAEVAERIPKSRRDEQLLFSYHAEVVDLNARDQARFLKMAKEKEFTRAELRAAIREENADVPANRDTAEIPKTFRTWTTHLRLSLQREKVETWSAERREATKKELAWLVEFWRKL